MAVTAASIAASARTARPRLGCRTVPVRLKTARTFGCAAPSRRDSAAAAMESTPTPSDCPAFNAMRVASSACRTAATVAGRPKRSAATMAACAFNTSSTEGKRRSASDPCAIDCPSITDEEGVAPAAPQAGLPNQQVETQRGDIVGDGIERDVLLVMQDLHIGPALVAALSLDRSWSALDFLIRDIFGRRTHAAFGTDVVPPRAAQRTGTESRSARTLPLHHQRRCRRPAAGRAHTVRNVDEVLGVELRREAR